MYFRLVLPFLLPWLAGCGGVATEPSPIDQGALLSASCSGCHASGGESIVSLDGMSVEDLQVKLLAYRDDADGGSSMHRMARGYSEQQIELIARTLGD